MPDEIIIALWDARDEAREGYLRAEHPASQALALRQLTEARLYLALYGAE